MLKFLTILFISMLVALQAYSADYIGGEANFTSTYESTGGKVTFPHGKHAEGLSTECNLCHSALRTFGGVTQVYGHKFCNVCHEKQGGPSDCNACHDKAGLLSANIKARD